MILRPSRILAPSSRHTPGQGIPDARRSLAVKGRSRQTGLIPQGLGCSTPYLLSSRQNGDQCTRPFVPTPQHCRPRRNVGMASAAAGAGGLVPLGLDLLAFLGSTVIIIPIFKRFDISPVLGFLFAGVVLQQAGITNDLEDLSKLSELGVLFLLFEMGLELSLSRLKALAKYAFGIGSLQMLLCVAIFTAFALPVGDGIGTTLLQNLAHAPAELVRIRTVDELLGERGELTSRFGSATLGVLLFQVVADSKNSETFVAICLLTVAGAAMLTDSLSVVADSKNSETYVAICLLTVAAGAAMLTESLGFSDTLGAFIAGILLSETNYKTQVEADIKPFRGLLLGLFFVTTGASINLQTLADNWKLVAWLLAGLLSIKTGVIATNESLRLGFTLSQGGEFAFVLLSLAKSLDVLPEDLNEILIIVVVLSMAMTPALAEGGRLIADKLDEFNEKRDPTYTFDEGELSSLPTADYDEQSQVVVICSFGLQAQMMSNMLESPIIRITSEPVVICGFGLQAQMMANMLESPILGVRGQRYVAFDLDPKRVAVARSAGFSVVYGDGSRQAVLSAAGIKNPKAIVVCVNDRNQAVDAVHSLRVTYPNVQIYACGKDLNHAARLEEAGANSVVLGPTMAGLALGAQVLEGSGVSNDDIAFLRSGITDALVAHMRRRQERVLNPDLPWGSKDEGDDPRLNTPSKTNTDVKSENEREVSKQLSVPTMAGAQYMDCDDKDPLEEVCEVVEVGTLTKSTYVVTDRVSESGTDSDDDSMQTSNDETMQTATRLARKLSN
eukprot:gene17163-23474_t